MGLEMTVHWTADSSKSPRGIRGYELLGGSFTQWRVQGKAGGYLGFVKRFYAYSKILT